MAKQNREFLLKLCTLSLSLGASFSCTPQDGGFAGDSGRGGAQQTKPPPTQEPPKNDVPPKNEPPKPTPCTEAKLESVNSLTSFVDQTMSTGTLVLELNFIPCLTQAGKVSLPIMFDIDADTAFLKGQEQRLTYEVSIQGVRIAGPGYVNTISGKDLFGKQRKDYVYFQSDGSIAVGNNISSARLDVKLGSMYVMAPVNSSSAAKSNFTVPIYVKVGNSYPVTAKVSFTPAIIPP